MTGRWDDAVACDPSLLADAAAIVATDDHNRAVDPDGIGRAVMLRHQDSARDTADWMIDRLAFRNFWTAPPWERQHWLAAVDGLGRSE